MLSYLILFTIGTLVFAIFITISTLMLNQTVKQCALYRKRILKRDKIFHNLYSMAYSAIFSSMIIASVLFPIFLMNIRQPINIPPIQDIIVESIKDSYSTVVVDGENFNIFNEIDKISKRFENEEVFK